MKTSAHGRALITQWEGKRNYAYKDSAGLLTIGVGHLLTRDELTSGKILVDGEYIKYGDGLSDSIIDKILAHDLGSAENTLNDCLCVNVNQDQYDGLVAFVFNVGSSAFKNSTLLKVINAKDYANVPTQMRRWNRAGGMVIPGLIVRRENEIKLMDGIVG